MKDTFAEAIADAIRAGRLLIAIGSRAPIFDHFHLHHGPDGQLHGSTAA